MEGNIIFIISLTVSAVIGLIYFRDPGDVSQMIVSAKRKNMVRFIRYEYRLLAIGPGATTLMAIDINHTDSCQ